MLAFTQFLLLFSSFLFSVFALPLAPRDVVSPPITSPTAGAVWNVGQTQTVTWNAAGLPVNQTNPIGMLVLGYLFNNSENLMLDSPLATNINYSTGQVQITVPNVPTRSDYIVVLFGDSGNASPEFTIINGASSSTPVAPSSPTIPADAATPTNPSPTPAHLSSQSGGSPPMTHTGPSTSATTPASRTGSPTNTTTVVVKATGASSSSSNSSAAWQRHVPSLATSLSVALAVVYFAFS